MFRIKLGQAISLWQLNGGPNEGMSLKWGSIVKVDGREKKERNYRET